MARVQDSKGVFKQKTTEMYAAEIAELYNGELEVVGSYRGCSNKLTHRCKKHNIEFNKTPSSALRSKKNMCPQCKGEAQHLRQRKSDKQFKYELKKRHKGDIVAVGEYKNTHTKMAFECRKCHTLFCSEPNSVLRISGCPECNTSKGELEIKRFLDTIGEHYKQQKTFHGCKDKGLLAFDFYLAEYNLLIEYDGIQHFEPVEFFGGEEGYINQVRRDTIKNTYAKENNINILRIPYTVVGTQVEKIILAELAQLRSKAEGLTPKSEIMI